MTKVMSAFDNAMIKAQCTAMDEASKMKQDKTSKFARIAITAMACMAMSVWMCRNGCQRY